MTSNKMQLNRASPYANTISSLMRKTKNTTEKTSEEALPEWAEKEIKSVQFGQPDTLARTGYILDIYPEQLKIDIQLYEALHDGRTIVEGVNIPRSLSMNDFMKGVVYEFRIKVFKGNLSDGLIDLLKSKYSLQMDAIYSFELHDIQLMDVESDVAKTSLSSESDDGSDGDE
jgi:hypothetical protein